MNSEMRTNVKNVCGKIEDFTLKRDVRKRSGY